MSAFPPTYPTQSPRMVAAPVPIATAPKPMNTESRAPTMMRLS